MAAARIVLSDAEGDESVWDIRGDLSFVHLYCTDAHLRRVGEEVWDRSPANFTLQEKTFASDDKITAVYRQFCWLTTGGSRRTS